MNKVNSRDSLAMSNSTTNVISCFSVIISQSNTFALFLESIH